MRFAKKLADRVVFLHEGEARFFGTMGGDGEESKDVIVVRVPGRLIELVLPAVTQSFLSGVASGPLTACVVTLQR